MSKIVKIYNKILDPKIWTQDQKLNPEVKNNLLKVALDFYKGTELQPNMDDVYFLGSSANYNWTPNSDIDLHILIDILDLKMPETYAKKFLKALSTRWNTEHDVKIKGHKIEVYIQDVRERNRSNGIYSLMNDGWVKRPCPQNVEIDENLVQQKYDLWVSKIDDAVKQEHPEKMKAIMDELLQFREVGLGGKGELSVENIVFKILRSRGMIDKLKSTMNKVYDRQTSVKEIDNIIQESIDVVINEMNNDKEFHLELARKCVDALTHHKIQMFEDVTTYGIFIGWTIEKYGINFCQDEKCKHFLWTINKVSDKMFRDYQEPLTLVRMIARMTNVLAKAFTYGRIIAKYGSDYFTSPERDLLKHFEDPMKGFINVHKKGGIYPERNENVTEYGLKEPFKNRFTFDEILFLNGYKRFKEEGAFVTHDLVFLGFFIEKYKNNFDILNKFIHQEEKNNAKGYIESAIKSSDEVWGNQEPVTFLRNLMGKRAYGKIIKNYDLNNAEILVLGRILYRYGLNYFNGKEKEFLSYYKDRMDRSIKTLEKSRDLGGAYQMYFSDDDKNENINESIDEPKMIIKSTKPQEIQICPHCNQEIYEKHVYSEDGGDTMRHSDCGGLIEYPEPNWDELNPEWRDICKQAYYKKKQRLKETPRIVKKKGDKNLYADEKPLRNCKVEDVINNIVIAVRGDPRFIQQLVIVYFMDSEESAQAMKNGQILCVRILPGERLEDIWGTKYKKQTEHILGIVESFVYEGETFVYKMTVKPGKRRQHINTLMLDALNKKYPHNVMTFSQATKDGEQFLKTYRARKGPDTSFLKELIDKTLDNVDNILLESPQFATLKGRKVKLSDEERKEIMDAGAVWHHGPGGKPSPAVWKAVVKGKTYYVSNTHRTYQVRNNIKSAIKAYFDVVEPSA